MRVYLAARYSRREELCEYRTQLEELGATVTSRWLNGEHQILDGQLVGEASTTLAEGDSPSPYATELRTRFALEDWADLMDATLFIAFTETPRTGPTRGGRHVELGAALASEKEVWVVGPRENVFCCLPEVTVYDAWQDALAALTPRFEPAPF